MHHIPSTRGIPLPEPVPCPVPAGSIIFHDGCTLHRSAVNRTDTWRRALILHALEVLGKAAVYDAPLSSYRIDSA